MLDLQKGDLVRITEKLKAGITVFDAVVSWVELRDGTNDIEWNSRGDNPKRFLYFGYVPETLNRGAWGCGKIYEEPKSYGFINVQILKRGVKNKNERWLASRYDLMS
jgi:hypothetical protein